MFTKQISSFAKYLIKRQKHPQNTALSAIMQYSFLIAPLLSSLSAFMMYLIAAGSAVSQTILSDRL